MKIINSNLSLNTQNLNKASKNGGFDEILENENQVLQNENLQNEKPQNQHILDLVSSATLARENFDKIVAVLSDITNADTNEKIDIYKDLNEAQRKDLVEFLASSLMLNQNLYEDTNINFHNVKIKFNEKYDLITATSDFVDKNNQKINPLDIFKNAELINMTTGEKAGNAKLSNQTFLGNKRANYFRDNLAYKEAAKEYVMGDKNGYFAYLKELYADNQTAMRKLEMYEEMARNELNTIKEEKPNLTLSDTKMLIEHKRFVNDKFTEYFKMIDELFSAFEARNKSFLHKVLQDDFSKSDEMLSKALNKI